MACAYWNEIACDTSDVISGFISKQITSCHLSYPIKRKSCLITFTVLQYFRDLHWWLLSTAA